MSNPFNNGTIVGNAARAPKLFEHANGGATVKLSVYARNTFKNKTTGKVESEIVELTGYVQVAANPGVFGCIGSGDRVAVSYSLKTEMYHGEVFDTVAEFNQAIDEYIQWYNTERIQQRLKGLTPMQYRNQTLEALTA